MTSNQANPRDRATEILFQVLKKNQPLEDVLNQSLRGLSPLDRALTRAMASTCLRHLGIIDALIDKMVDRPLPKTAENIRNIIRIGITQILFMDIPSHAAVHDTVELVPAKSKFKGLVNALLRRTDRQGPKLLGKMNQAKTNTPEWLWKSWVSFYGEDTTKAIATAHLQEAPLDFTVKENPEFWAEKLDAQIMPTGQLRKKAGGAVTKLSGFDEGAWWIQDFSASLPAKLFSDLKGKRVLDMCAAPGGKTAQLAAAGAEVTAMDRSKNRLKRLEENLSRLDMVATVIATDATKYKPDTLYDAILLDAPCSSTGTIRRHPDVAQLKTGGDVEKLATLQTRLLEAAHRLLKPGGTLIYSTCSLQPEEGEIQIADFLKNFPDMTRKQVQPAEIDGLQELINKDGDLRCLPSHLANDENPQLSGMDGFFACRLVKE